jgi:hypothetical protein
MTIESSKIKCPKHGDHCYAVLVNGAGMGPVYSMDFCPVCDAHLSASGICLNACHLSKASRDRFNSVLGKSSERKVTE